MQTSLQRCNYDREFWWAHTHTCHALERMLAMLSMPFFNTLENAWLYELFMAVALFMHVVYIWVHNGSNVFFLSKWLSLHPSKPNRLLCMNAVDILFMYLLSMHQINYEATTTNKTQNHSNKQLEHTRYKLVALMPATLLFVLLSVLCVCVCTYIHLCLIAFVLMLSINCS